MPRLHISVLEFQEACLEFPLVAWPDIYEFGRQPLCQLSQKFDVVAVRRVESEDEQDAIIEPLARLLKVIGSVRLLLGLVEQLKDQPGGYGKHKPLGIIPFAQY